MGDYMLGAIIGDIIGSIYEVNEIKNIKNNKIDYENRINILDEKTPLFSKNVSYTDDTVLTCAVANALLTDKNYYKNLKEFGIKEVKLGLDKYGRNRFGKGFCEWLKGDYIGDSYGNGCAMRISPIANYYDSIYEIIGHTIKATYPSHNSKESYLSSIAVSMSIYLAKNKLPKNYIKKTIEELLGFNLNYNLEDLQKNYKFTSRAINSVPQAIFCFLESNNFTDAIRKAISIGGDSDTIAAITGSIAEVYYGIDKELIEEVEKYLPEYIINIVNKFYKTLNKEEPFKNEIKDFFKKENIYKEEFFDYIRNKVKKIPSNSELDWYGCFPIVNNNVLKDIRVLVPKIVDEKTLLINIHEYIHAFELYNELGTIYEDRRKEREKYAVEMENKYIKTKSI